MSNSRPEHVAQPPPAGSSEGSPPRAGVPHEVAQPPSAGDCLAKPGKADYRRNLPHLQVDGKTIFLTFCTRDRWILPESVRDQVLHHCLHDHGSKVRVHGVVVMPDHVHMVFTPLQDANGHIPTRSPKSPMGSRVLRRTRSIACSGERAPSGRRSPLTECYDAMKRSKPKSSTSVPIQSARVCAAQSTSTLGCGESGSKV